MRAFHISHILLLLSFVGTLASPDVFAANLQFEVPCSEILTLDGKISIADDQVVDSFTNLTRYESAPQFGAAAMIGPDLIGRKVQVQIVSMNSRPSFLRGLIVATKDDWRSFQFVEENSGVVLQMQSEHPEMGIRRIEFLDPGFPQLSVADTALLEDSSLALEAQSRDLRHLAAREKIRRKIIWYREKNGRNLRTTTYDRFHKIAQLEYLLGLGRIDEALEAMRLDVDNAKISAVAIHKAVEMRGELEHLLQRPHSQSENNVIKSKLNQIEVRLREQGEILGTHYSDFRMYVDRLKQIRENKGGKYPEHMVRAGTKLETMITVVNASADLVPALLNGQSEPDLGFVQKAFFLQPHSLLRAMNRDLWGERMTFLWLLLNKITGQDLMRTWGERAIGMLPRALRMPFNAILRTKRDMDARRFDLPQILRLASLDGQIPDKLEELRRIFYGDPDSKLLKNFARLVDADVEKLWGEMLAEAKQTNPKMYELMLQHEKVGEEEWGPYSKHYHQNGLNMTAAVITLGGVGSGYLFHQYGPQNNLLWKALDLIASVPVPW